MISPRDTKRPARTVEENVSEPAVDKMSETSAGRGMARVFLVLDVLLILMVGTALRAYRLEAQSVWLDEYFSAAYLDAPDLMSCLRDQRPENWEMVPVYYAVEYLWAQVVGGSIEGVRWLSILFGMAAILLTYAFGRELAGRWAGLIAAWCLVLSPFHIFHAQGIRPYALVTMLGVLSCYALWKALHGGPRRWWALHVAANVLLMWTHLFGILLLAPQGLYLLVYHGRRLRRPILWIAGHLLLLLPVALWVSTIRMVPDPAGTPPTWSDFAQLILSRDAEYLRWAGAHTDKIAELEVPLWIDVVAHALTQIEWGLHRILLIGSILALWWGVRRPLLRWVSRGCPQPASPHRYLLPRNDATLLALWLCVPVLLLFAFAWMLKPGVFQSRYVIYSYPALFLLVGVGAARGTLGTRLVFLSSLVVLFGAEASLTSAVSIRTDYRGAARLIQAEAHPNDLVLAQNWNVMRVLAFNLDDPEVRIDWREHLPELWQAIDSTLSQGNDVWLVLAADADRPELPQRCTDQFRASGIPFVRTNLLGMLNLYVFHCRPPNRPHEAAP